MHMISFPTKYSFHRLPHCAHGCLSAVANWNNNKNIIYSLSLSLFRCICVWRKWLTKNATKRRYNFYLQRRDRPQIKADPYEIIVALTKSVSSGTGFLFKIITYKNSLRPNNLAWQSFCLFLRDQQYDKFSNLFHLIHRVKNRTIPDWILVLVF